MDEKQSSILTVFFYIFKISNASFLMQGFACKGPDGWGNMKYEAFIIADSRYNSPRYIGLVVVGIV